MFKVDHSKFTACLFFLLPVLGTATPTQAQNFSSFAIEGLTSPSYDARPRKTDSILTLKYANSWSKGDNFLFADITSPTEFSEYDSTYLEWAPRISLGKLTNGQAFQFGIISDVYLMGEINHLHNKSGTNTSRLFGISVDLALPGFKFFKVHMENRDDPSLTGNTEQISLIWNYPFTFGKYNFSFEGFLDYVSNEGRKSPNLLTQPQLLWKSGKNLDIGLEYQYWRNKFGSRGLNESAMQALVRWNF